MRSFFRTMAILGPIAALALAASNPTQSVAAAQQAGQAAPPADRGGAQQPTTQPPAADQQGTQPPQFRAGINFVRVDVIASDKNGNAIADLKQTDFDVTEDGKPQTVET